MSYPTKDKRDHHRELTDKIIAKMEEAVKYEKGWFTSTTAPYNPVTGTRYKGINAISLSIAGFDDPRFFTYNNVVALAEKLGAEKPEDAIHVMKGAKGIPVFKAAQIKIREKEGTVKKDTDPDNKANTFWMMVYAGTVFNASQINGIPPLPARTAVAFEDHAEAEYVADAMQIKSGLTIKHGTSHGRAFYQPSTDVIELPNKSDFKSLEDYYRTKLHELGHSTGHPDRLNRKLVGAYGTPEYAYEELIAELSSYFMGNEVGIPYNPNTHDNHAAYLKNWITALQGDKNYIFRAATAASKACEFQLKLTHEYKQDVGLLPADEPATAVDAGQETGLTTVTGLSTAPVAPIAKSATNRRPRI